MSSRLDPGLASRGTGRYSERLADEQQGVKLVADASGSSGSLEIEVDVSGKIGARLRDLNGDENTETIDIRFLPASRWDGEQDLRNQVRQISSIVSQKPGDSLSSTANPLPDEIRNINSEGVPLFAGVFGQKVAGQQDPPAFTKSLNFQPIPIPEASGTGSYSSKAIFGQSISASGASETISVDSLPDIPVQVEAVPKEFIQRSVGSLPSVELSIPPEIFFGTYDLSDVDCSTLYPDIDRQIDRYSDEVDGFLSEIRSNLNGVTDSNVSQATLRQRTQQIDPAPTGFSDFRSGVSSFISGELNSAVRLPNCAEEFADRLLAVEDKFDRAESLLSELRDALENISGNVLNCTSEFSSIDSSISDIESELNRVSTLSQTEYGNIQSDIERVADRVSSIRSESSTCFDRFNSRINSLRSTADTLRSGGDLDCTDISSSIRSSVNRFERRVSTVQSRSGSGVDSQTVRSLADDGEALRTRIRDSTVNSNPCQGQLIQRVEAQLRVLDNLGSGGGGTGGGGEDVIVCSEEYPDASRAVDSFREASLNLEPPVSPSEFQQISKEAAEVRDEIRENIPADSDCRDEFLGRLETAVGRVRRLRSTVRIESGGGGDADQETQELIQQLTEQLDSITVGEEDSDLPAT